MKNNAKFAAIASIALLAASQARADWWCEISCTAEVVEFEMSCGAGNLLNIGSSIPSILSANSDSYMSRLADAGDWRAACMDVADQMASDCGAACAC